MLKVVNYLRWPLLPENRYREQFLYGHREILIAYADLPDSAVLTGYLQHGFDVLGFQASQLSRAANMAEAFQWVWMPSTEVRARARGHKRVRAIGAPWLYLLHRRNTGSLFEIEPPTNDPRRLSPDAQRLLFAPSHWDQFASVDLHSRMCERIREVVTPSDTVTVLLHGLDFLQMKTRDVYETAGFRTTCLGWPKDSPRSFPVYSDIGDRVNFLTNLAELLERSDALIVEGMGSLLFYASAVGLPVYWLGGPRIDPSALRGASANFRRIDQETDDWLVNLLKSCGVSPRTQGLRRIDPEPLQGFARTVLGQDAMMAPEELRGVLRWTLRDPAEYPINLI